MEKILTHEELALARLPTQFRKKRRIRDLLSIFLTQIQDLEDALWDVAELRALPAATGAQLDRFGEILDQKREGDPDETYRKKLKVKILRNTAEGTPDRIIRVIQLLSAGEVTYTEVYPAAFSFEVIAGEEFDEPFLIRLIREIKPAGVGYGTSSGEPFVLSSLITLAEDGYTEASPDPTDRFKSATAQFSTSGVAAGHEVVIYSGPGVGRYDVLSVVSETELEVDGSLPASLSSIVFDVRENDPTGQGLSDTNFPETGGQLVSYQE